MALLAVLKDLTENKSATRQLKDGWNKSFISWREDEFVCCSEQLVVVVLDYIL